MDEDYLIEGDIVFSELMINPDEVGDKYGEWIEVFNASSEDIDLIGWTLDGSDGDRVTIEDRTVVSAGGYGLGRSLTSRERRRTHQLCVRLFELQA